MFQLKRSQCLFSSRILYLINFSRFSEMCWTQYVSSLKVSQLKFQLYHIKKQQHYPPEMKQKTFPLTWTDFLGVWNFLFGVDSFSVIAGSFRHSSCSILYAPASITDRRDVQYFSRSELALLATVLSGNELTQLAITLPAKKICLISHSHCWSLKINAK